MHKWTGKIVLLALLTFSLQAQSADWHCLTNISQTSVDFEGKVIRTTCMDVNPDAAKVAEEKKNCERGSRKNKAKAWLKGACPTKNRIGTCTITKIGPATLPQPKIIHTYEEHGGNLSLEEEVNLACQQCSQMSLNSGKFVESVPVSSPLTQCNTSVSAEESATDQAQEQNNSEKSGTNEGVKKSVGFS